MVLCINTKDIKQVTLSLKRDGEIVDEVKDFNEYGSQILLPLTMKLLEKNKIGFKDLIGVEVEEGSGSFTGLRVGASVAQALGYALNIPVNGEVNKPVNLQYT